MEEALAVVDSRQIKAFIDENPQRAKWNTSTSTELERLNNHIQEQSRRIESIQTLLTGLQRGSLTTDQGTVSLSTRTRVYDTTTNTALATYMLGTTNSISSLSPFPTCEAPCPCPCHAARGHAVWRTEALQPLLGSLSVSYRGGLTRQGKCTVSGCRNSRGRENRRLRVDYRLPPWLLGLALTVCVSTGPPSPELLIRVVRRISRNSREITRSIFYLVRRNDLEGLKSALASRSVSVYDELADDGTTALRQAWLAVQSKAAAKILIQAGADLFQGPSPSNTAMAAFLKSLHIDASAVNDIASILPISLDTVLDEWGYTDLHKIVLGILPLDLPSVLRYSRTLVAEVNKATITGITPLHLAATRNDVPALRALLEAGADQGLRSSQGLTAFHSACMGRGFASARLLLDHGANVQATAAKLTPLHWITSSAHDDSPQLTDLLLDRGADINAKGTCGSSPLAIAVMNDHINLAEHFLNRGADINAQDDGGDPPLSEAVVNGSHRSARMLLARGADYRTVNLSGMGILHLLADSADEEMLKVFVDARMSGLDETLRDIGGLTAMEALEKRSPSVSARYRETFMELLKSVGTAAPSQVGSPREGDSDEDSSSEDDYFDAVEISHSGRVAVQVESEVIQVNVEAEVGQGRNDNEDHIEDDEAVLWHVDDNKFRLEKEGSKFDGETWKRIRQLP